MDFAVLLIGSKEMVWILASNHLFIKERYRIIQYEADPSYIIIFEYSGLQPILFKG